MTKLKIFVKIVPVTVTVVFAVSLSVGDAMFTRQIEAGIERLFAISKNIYDTIFTYKQISGTGPEIFQIFDRRRKAIS